MLGQRKSIKKIPLERTIQSEILRYMESIPGGFAWKNQAGPYARKGLPDLNLVLNGRYYGFEVKRPGGKLTKLQLNTLEELRTAGAVAEVVYSVDDVKKTLELISKETSNQEG